MPGDPGRGDSGGAGMKGIYDTSKLGRADQRAVIGARRKKYRCEAPECKSIRANWWVTWPPKSKTRILVCKECLLVISKILEAEKKKEEKCA